MRALLALLALAPGLAWAQGTIEPGLPPGAPRSQGFVACAGLVTAVRTEFTGFYTPDVLAEADLRIERLLAAARTLRAQEGGADPAAEVEAAAEATRRRIRAAGGIAVLTGGDPGFEADLEFCEALFEAVKAG